MSTTGVWSLRQVNKNILDCNWTYYDAPFLDSNIYVTKVAGFGSVKLFGLQNYCELTCASSSPVQVGGTNWSSVARGEHSFSTIKTDGTLWSWGCNSSGNFGNNNYWPTISPVQTSGTNWCFITKTENSSFALKTNNTLWAWGTNTNGDLAQNSLTPTDSLSPIQIPGTNWCYVCSNGGAFGADVVALKNNNTLWVWGVNSSGQFGLNDIIKRSSPTQIPGTNWCSATITSEDMLALKTDGTLWSAGSAIFLGNNIASISRSSPVQVAGTNWCAISGGDSSNLALKTDNTLWAWGVGSLGELGNNSNVTRSSPIQIPGTNWCAIGASYGNNFAIKTDNTLWSWGSAAFLAHTTDDNVPRSSPIQIPGTNWNRIYKGGKNSVSNAIGRTQAAIKTDGTLWTWGSNYSYGMLGIGIDGNGLSSPTLLTEKSIYCILCPSLLTFAGIKPRDNTLWTWGCAVNGRLGLNDTIDRSSPIQIPGSWKKGVFSVTPVAIKTDNTLWTWSCGEFDVNVTVCYSSPVQIPGTSWCDVALFSYRSIFLQQTNNTLWVTGVNSSGNLGLNDIINRSSPVQLPGTNWSLSNSPKNSAVSALFKTDGTLWVWGLNNNGILGSNDVNARSSPIQLPGTNWKQLSTGNAAFGLKTDGTLWSWGYNYNGDLGNNSRICRSSPIQIPGTNWIQVSAAYAAYARKTDNTLWAWGCNENGILGLGDFVPRSSPTQIPGLWNDICHSEGSFFGFRYD